MVQESENLPTDTTLQAKRHRTVRAAFRAAFALMTGELAALLDDLVSALGGERDDLV